MTKVLLDTDTTAVTGAVSSASDTVAGKVELATTAETTTGTDTTRAVTPAGVKAVGDTKLALAGGTMTGAIAMGDQNITGAGAISFTQELDNNSKTASFTIDFATDQHQAVTLTANTMTITLDTTSVGVGVYTVRIVNGGLATITWASESGSIKWAGGTAPTLTASGEDIVSFRYNGTDWYGVASLSFS